MLYHISIQEHPYYLDIYSAFNYRIMTSELTFKKYMSYIEFLKSNIY